jgi:hypothetical protein
MKRLSLLFLLFPLFISAQFVAPAASPVATAETAAGYTNLSINYHRPNVRGRVIFGDLLPWDEVWRAGANENTLLTFDKDVEIGGEKVAAGTYSLYLKPSDTEDWTWILNRATKNWGARGYDVNLDVVRISAKAKKLPERIETLEYRWMNVTPQSADLVFEWEWRRVELPVALSTDAQVVKAVDENLNPAKDPKEYYAAARYYLDNGLDLKQAKKWMDLWAAGDEEQFGRMRYQAIIEYKLGNKKEGRRLMARSLELAKEKNNGHYVLMNEESLKGWTKELVEMSGDSLLAKTIRYHDPKSQWEGKSHLLQLAESRPSGGINQTRLTLYPGKADFDMQQVRGRDKVQMRYLNGTYSFSHQGRTDIPDKDRKRLGLTEDRTLMMRDYYTYLFGLPMKLKDEGTIIKPDVHKVWFNGEELLRLEAHYSPEKGRDVWFFYIDPVTYAMKGYAFYHAKDGPGTGEYIILEEEAVVGKMLLPAERHWYYTKNNLYLGTDEILR